MAAKTKKFQDACLRAACEFDRVLLHDIKYQPGGILPSEILFFAALCKAQNIDLIIESGRKRGYSTEVLSRLLPRTQLVSIDRRPRADLDCRFDHCDNVILVTGQSEDELQKYSDRLHYRRAALLVDGPKGDPAFELAFPYVASLAFYAVHDCNDRTFKKSDPHFVVDAECVTSEGYDYLDEQAWRGTYSSRREMTADSFTLAMFPGGQFNWPVTAKKKGTAADENLAMDSAGDSGTGSIHSASSKRRTKRSKKTRSKIQSEN